MKYVLSLFGLLAQVLFLSAHPMPNTLIALIVGPGRLVFDLKIPLLDVETALSQSADSTVKGFGTLPMFAVLDKYFSKHVHLKGMDGTSWPLQLASIDTLEAADPFVGNFPALHAILHATPPDTDIRQFFLYYDAILHQIITHQAILSIRQDWDNGIHIAEGDTTARILSVIQVDHSTGEILPVAVKLEKGSIWTGFFAMFRLGMKHIAEGYDHLLFLLVLLLPAPLLADKRRWGGFGGWRYSAFRILKIVTAFTIGHSLTLIAAALGWFRLPEQPVEVVIALSILASAVHAFRPIFAGREAWVAGGFGLVHGLAFASILSNLNLDTSRLTLSILGFNLGIEAMQLTVVAVALPILMLLGRTRLYPFYRVGGAIAAAILAIFWVTERITW